MDIKNCPFCGSKAEIKTKGTSYSLKEYYEVACSNLDCYLHEGADYGFYTKEEAINTWNESIKQLNKE